MKRLAFIICAIVSFSVYGQVDSTALKYGATITSKDLSKHLHILASDEYEGRETGRKGQKMAAKYIADHFKNIGIPELKNGGYYQEIPLMELRPTGTTIDINGISFEFLKDYFFYRGFNDESFGLKDVVFLGYGIDDENYSDYKDVDVTGKFLIILDKEPKNKKGLYYVNNSTETSKWSINRRLKVSTAKDKGAIGMFVIKQDFSSYLKQSKHYLETPSMGFAADFEGESKTLPTFYISEKMGNAVLSSEGKTVAKLKSKIDKKGKGIHLALEIDIKIRMNRDREELFAENVLGYVEGSDLKEELIVVTGHYDHIGIDEGVVYNGADDDGSGTVAVMEMAQAFIEAKKAGKGPRRSLLFMTVSGEEKGLLGSEYYSKNPVFPLENTVANLNIDMIGREDDTHKGDPDYIYIIGSTMLSSELHSISEEMDRIYTPNIKLDYTFNTKEDPNRYYYRSDHYNFAKNNIPVIFYFNGVHEDYHEATDTVDKIDFQKMENITRLVFHTAWQLANQDKRIEVDLNQEEGE